MLDRHFWKRVIGSSPPPSDVDMSRDERTAWCMGWAACRAAVEGELRRQKEDKDRRDVTTEDLAAELDSLTSEVVADFRRRIEALEERAAVMSRGLYDRAEWIGELRERVEALMERVHDLEYPGQ